MGTPLCEAVINGKYEAVECLLMNGVDVNKQNRYGMTAFHMACSHNKLDIASLLLSHGANMYERGIDNDAPISWASSYEMVDLLICNGFDLSALSGCRISTLLHMYMILSKRCSYKQLDIAYNMVAAEGMLKTIIYLYTVCKHDI
jgi:ankyrin repeat protein